MPSARYSVYRRWLGPLLGVLLVVGNARPAIAPLLASNTTLSENTVRARATRELVTRYFAADLGRFNDAYPAPADQYATLWPLTQTIVGFLSAEDVEGERTGSAGAFFDPYWDAAATPPGYSASMQPPLGPGDRKFFDDNAWTGLALVKAYKQSGDVAALARARQVFAYVLSGWDNDATHGAPGGVWWSEQMPNPRFRHRNTVSTATGAELGFQLYLTSGRADQVQLEWSTRMYDWVETYLRGANGLYGDHVDLEGVVDPGQLAYNQGTMIGASLLRYQISGDPAYLERARAIADAAVEAFGPDFGQAPIYNAILFRNLLPLEAATGDQRYRTAMQNYADGVWDSVRDPASGLFDFAYGRNRSVQPHRLIDQAAMLQIYADLALGREAAANLT